jgi:hypothetical protein
MPKLFGKYNFFTGFKQTKQEDPPASAVPAIKDVPHCSLLNLPTVLYDPIFAKGKSIK